MASAQVQEFVLVDSFSYKRRPTSPSPQGPGERFVVEAPASPSPTKRRKSISSDEEIPLALYLPIGVLTIRPSHVPLDLTSDWTEVQKETALFVSTLLQLDLWPLIRSLWIRVHTNADLSSLRVYLLPDDVARAKVERRSRPLRKALELLLVRLDTSSGAWNGKSGAFQTSFDLFATADPNSLFYIFNKLPSPDPRPELVTNRFSRAAMMSILDSDSELLGLKTTLFPYQQRSTAMMIQREAAPDRQLDPRLEKRFAPSGEPFFYAPRNRTFLRQPRLYEAVRGGILAESMGLGKTLMCISLILATRGHLPDLPPIHAPLSPIRSTVGSLFDMAVSATSRHSIPWKSIHSELGQDVEVCRNALETNPPFYHVPPRPSRSPRKLQPRPSTAYRRCSGTIIVVPLNLVHQWKSELEKHVEPGVLRVLVLSDLHEPIPLPAELATYDIILFSRPRFERELPTEESNMVPSVLSQLHWLRIIVDEGHSFSANTTRAVAMAKSIQVERRWVISGTPAKDLLGIEIDLAASIKPYDVDAMRQYRVESLEQRRSFGSASESSDAVESIGSLAQHFLKAQPWDNPDTFSDEPPVFWNDEIYRHETLKGRTKTCFSSCLGRTLSGLVIKTQPDDVESDIVLPPLTHEIIRLEPSFHDKLTANNFVMVFTNNAITSERTDNDYLFHPTNRAQLHKLVTNLRRSTFNWTGLNALNMREALNIANKYLEKPDTTCSIEDRELLRASISAANIAMNSTSWNNLTFHNDVGLFFDAWPNGTERAWSMESDTRPLLVGLAQAWQAQKHVNEQLHLENPLAHFVDEGARILAEANTAALEESSKQSTKATTKAGVSSTVSDDLIISSKAVPKVNSATASPQKASHDASLPASRSQDSASITLHDHHCLARTKLVGTTSAKLSYILSRVEELYKDEKILIFYEGGHIAYYLSYALDLLHIRHLWYTKELKGNVRSRYAVLFDSDPHNRVMLMDVAQAAHGLNLSAASRVIFVTPPCRPNIVAQAVKRAHRIGQTRPVKVETLILRGTVEEAMHDRAGHMTRDEHSAAKSLEDDSTITHIIQKARALQIRPHEMEGAGQVAWLDTPQQFWGRPGRTNEEISEYERELFPEGANKRKKGRLVRESTGRSNSEAASSTAT